MRRAKEVEKHGHPGQVVGYYTVERHKGSHGAGGTDEVYVDGLRGLLADAQTPRAHAASHGWGGADTCVAGRYWDPLAAPKAAGALDDEFQGDALGAHWTAVGGTALTAAMEVGLLRMTSTAATFPGIGRSLPAGQTKYTISAAGGVSWILGSALPSWGISLWEDVAAGGRLVTAGVVATASGWSARIADHVSWQTIDASPTVVAASSYVIPQYVRLRRAVDTLYLDISGDGANWMRSASRPLAFTPTAAGLFVSSGAWSTVTASYRFFRYMGSNVGTTALLDGRRVGY